MSLPSQVAPPDASRTRWNAAATDWHAWSTQDDEPPQQLDLSTRSIVDSDLGFLRSLYATTRTEELAATGWPEKTRQQFLTQQFNLQHRHYQAHYAKADFLLLLLGVQPVGRLYWLEQDTQATLVDISLLPAHRGKGLGSALLAALTAHADLMGQSIDLHVVPSSRARRLYERFDFRAKASNGMYLRMLRSPQNTGHA